MMITKWRDLLRDQSGKGIIKLALTGSVLAVAVASSSPAFETNPFISKTVRDMREHLPATLDKVRRAMGGD